MKKKNEENELVKEGKVYGVNDNIVLILYNSINQSII